MLSFCNKMPQDRFYRSLRIIIKPLSGQTNDNKPRFFSVFSAVYGRAGGGGLRGRTVSSSLMGNHGSFWGKYFNEYLFSRGILSLFYHLTHSDAWHMEMLTDAKKKQKKNSHDVICDCPF